MSLWDTITSNPLQSIALAITILSVIVTITIFYKNRKLKSLCYNILTNTPLLTIDEGLEGKIKIYYLEEPSVEKPIKNLSVIILKFFNNGNEPIKSSDFESLESNDVEKSIKISFGQNMNVLSAEQIDSSPKKINATLNYSADQVYIEPLLLNPNDSITIKILLTGNDKIDDVNVDGWMKMGLAKT